MKLGMGLGQSELIATVEQALMHAGADVWITDSDALPAVVANHPRCGLIAIDLVAMHDDAMVALNRKVATLRSAVPELARTQVLRHLMDTERLADVADGAWLDDLPDRVYEPEATRALATYFGPRVTIEVPVRAPMRDSGATDRAAHRIRLDAQQAEAALRDVDGMLAITGPPGSGKTLVLCARANRLAEQHPDWDIRVLCYNRMLAPYLKKLTSAHPNIRVDTVGKFSASLGVRMSLNDPDRAWRDLDAAVRQGLVPHVDAVLIDEWQDFYPAWTALAERVLRPGRGGMVVAGDPNQALYHDLGMDKPVSIAHGDPHSDAALSLNPPDPRCHLSARQATRRRRPRSRFRGRAGRPGVGDQPVASRQPPSPATWCCSSRAALACHKTSGSW